VASIPVYKVYLPLIKRKAATKEANGLKPTVILAHTIKKGYGFLRCRFGESQTNTASLPEKSGHRTL